MYNVLKDRNNGLLKGAKPKSLPSKAQIRNQEVGG